MILEVIGLCTGSTACEIWSPLYYEARLRLKHVAKAADGRVYVNEDKL